MEWFLTLPGVDELETAEEFLSHFELAFDTEQLRISRLHIMHRFHQALSQADGESLDEAGRFALAQQLLGEAYQTFHHQPVRGNSSLKVYQRLEPFFIPLSQLQEVRL
jgi:nitrogenase-stabilizing/protective protein